MSEMVQPNIGADAIRIHRIITRGLKVGIERSRAFAQEGYPDAATQGGFISYVQSLASVLHGHHVTEDDLIFPYLRDRLPEAPYDLLSAQHRELEPLLEETQATLEAVAAEAQPGAALDDLNRTLSRIAEIWYPHIQIEEERFGVQALAALIEADEHVRLGKESAQYGQEHAGPGYLTVPFMLYNLPAEDRAILAQAMPPVVTQQLVPGEWKEQWAPMAPFLLD